MTGSRIKIKIRPSGDRRLLSRVWKFSTGERNLIGMVTLKLNECSVHANTLASAKMMDKLGKKISAKDNVPEKKRCLVRLNEKYWKVSEPKEREIFTTVG